MSSRKKPSRIEPFRHKVETDPRFFEKAWRKLDDAIREIYNHNASGLSFEELYRFPIPPSPIPSRFSLSVLYRGRKKDKRPDLI
jgi:hypothetical protein